VTRSLRPLSWLLLAALPLWAAPAPARGEPRHEPVSEWAEEDVEAAEAYRQVERARAERYRAEVARREAARRAPRVATPAPASGGPLPAGVPAWWARTLAELDRGLERVSRGADTVDGWRAFWSDEVAPRWRDWRDWLDREQEPDSLAQRLVHVMLDEVHGERRAD
jgi:hypothetical protein